MSRFNEWHISITLASLNMVRRKLREVYELDPKLENEFNRRYVVEYLIPAELERVNYLRLYGFQVEPRYKELFPWVEDRFREELVEVRLD